MPLGVGSPVLKQVASSYRSIGICNTGTSYILLKFSCQEHEYFFILCWFVTRFDTKVGHRALITEKNTQVQLPFTTVAMAMKEHCCRSLYRYSLYLNVFVHITSNMKFLLASGDRPYSCSECRWKFASKTHLNRHMKIHEVWMNNMENICQPSTQCSFGVHDYMY